MRVSNYFLPTLKETPTDAQIVSHRLMLRAGMIRQMSSGIYSWLPLGLRVLKNIENIVRQEQNDAGATELLMPTIQSADLWRESGRYDAYGPEMLRMKDRHDRDMLFGPTNEEMITDIVRNTIKSYKKLPQILYHLQWKFRDEIRPRFGVMRGREFMMKDCYSFDMDADSARFSYRKMMVAYLKTFARLGLTAIPMQADTGPIGGDMSHEFLVLAPTGESAVYFDKKFYDTDYKDLTIDYQDTQQIDKVFDTVTHLYAVADEKYQENEFRDHVPEDRRIAGRGIEVGHIFYLGTKYSDSMGAVVQNPDGTEQSIHMGCYGIGVSRLVATLIEASHDDKGIIWNMAVTPFHVGLINLHQGTDVTDSLCRHLYTELQNAGITVLYHDTTDRAGAKFADMDLIGLPYQMIIGKKSAENNMVELKDRKTGEVTEFSADNIVSYFKENIL